MSWIKNMLSTMFGMMDGPAGERWRTMENDLLAVAGGLLVAFLTQYVPPTIAAAFLMIATVVAIFCWYAKPVVCRPIWLAFTACLIWTALSQPMYGFMAPLIFGACALLFAAGKVSVWFGNAKISAPAKLVWLLPYGIAVAIALATAYGCELIYVWLLEHGLPAAQPALASMYMVAPVMLIALATMVTFYCSWRLRTHSRVIYKIMPAATAAVFAIAFPMYEPDGSGWAAYITWGNAVEWAFVLLVLVLGLADMRRWLRAVAVPVAVAYCGLFALFTAVPELHELMIAQSLTVRQPDHLPLSTDKPRTMPYVVGEKRCIEGNAQSAMHVGPVSFAMEADGRIDYQCALHFDGFVAGNDPWSGVVSLIPGATDHVVRVESTNTSGEITPVEAIFPFGETSPILRSSIILRHPGAALGDFSYSESEGKLQLVYSYTLPRLFWFTMVPSSGGAVAETQDGVLQDYTVEHAGRDFPGAFLVPAELVRQKSEAWAHYRVAAWWPFRQEKALSEPGETLSQLPPEQRKLFGDNRPPFAIPTQKGPKYWLLLEPYGGHGTAGSEVLLFDARYPGLVEMKDTTRGRVVKGLRDVVKQAPAVVQGNFNLRGSEVYLYITQKDLYFIIPLLDNNGNFIGASVLRSDETIVYSDAVTTSADVVRHIRDFEKTH